MVETILIKSDLTKWKHVLASNQIDERKKTENKEQKKLKFFKVNFVF